MKKMFSAILGMIALSLSSMAIAEPIPFGDIQLEFQAQDLSNPQIGFLNAGNGHISDFPYADAYQIDIFMDEYGVVSSQDATWDFEPFRLIAINTNVWEFDIGKLEPYSNNGNFIDGIYGYGLGLYITAKAPIETPEPSGLVLISLTFLLLLIARKYHPYKEVC